MIADCLEKSALSKLLPTRIVSLRDAIRINYEGIARSDFDFTNRRLPLFEQAQNRCCGGQAFRGTVGAHQERGIVPAISKAQPASGVLIVTEEKRRVAALVRALVERLVHRLEKLSQILRSDSTLAAHVGL